MIRAGFNSWLVAVSAVVAGTLLRLPLTSLLGPGRAPLQIYFLSVFVAAWLAGRKAGLIATLLSAVVSYSLFVPRVDVFWRISSEDVFRYAIFITIGVVISLLSESRLRALEREAAGRQALEAERRDRTAAVEDAARERDRLALMTDHAPILLAHCDRERRFKFASRPYAARLGLQPQDLIGRHIKEVLGPEVDAVITPYVERVLAGEPVEYEMVVPYPRIGPQHLRVAYAPERDPSGQVTGWIAALTNITGQKQAESEARRLAAIVEHSRDFIGVSDLDFKVQYVNPAGAALVGLTDITPASMARLSVLDFFHPDDVPRLQRDFFPAVRRDGRAEIEIRFRHFASGEFRWMAYSVVLLTDDAGRPSQFATISRDIHDRKLSQSELTESRERLRAALAASGTGTFRWDIQTNELDWDENLDRLFGVDREATARSLEQFLRLVHPDDRERVVQACQRSSDSGADFEEEFRVIWPNGTVRWLYDKGRTYSDERGRPLYMSGACVDVTERRAKEDALKAADRQKDEFLGMLAHELRNPLAPIMYSVELLERQLGPDGARQPLDIISRQVKRMSRMVDDLLDVSRVTQGKVSLQRVSLDLVEAVRAAGDAARPSMLARRHRFEVRLPAEPLWFDGDPVRLAQIVENLLTNAAKYTPAGGQISMILESEGDGAVLSVRDTGIGIAAEVLPQIFDLFVQADTSLDRSEGGLGIGLTLVDRLTRMHGGSVEARSDGPGKGSCFVVRLPLLASAQPAADPGSRPVSRAGARRYLVVDDNYDSAEMLGLLLEIKGHDVRVVHDGPAALAAAREFRPDVVLMDVGMPGMDGYEVVRRFRASPELATMCVIATTGYGRAEDRTRCLAAGFDHHLTKPIDVDAIEALVARTGD